MKAYRFLKHYKEANPMFLYARCYTWKSLKHQIYVEGDRMYVYLLKDIEKVGMKGTVVKTADGFAENFIIPRKLGIKVSESELAFYQNKKVKEQVNAEVISSKVAMLAERIKSIHLSIKERAHDDGKLYGSVGADEIVELLKKQEVNVNRKQVEFDKAIRKVGEHKVTIKLSTKLKPQLTLKVTASEVR